MFAPVQARSNAPNENVVGSPIFEFAQSACVRNAVAAMKRSGRIAESAEAGQIADDERPRADARRRRRRAGARRDRDSAARHSALLPRQEADLEEADRRGRSRPASRRSPAA